MKCLEYFIPVISSMITFFSLKTFNIATYIPFIPIENQKDFNLTFYTAVISILFIRVKNLIGKALEWWYKNNIVLIVHRRNETPNENYIPEIIFNNQVAEFSLTIKIKGNYEKLENMSIRIQLPIWADFQPKNNIVKNDVFYEIKIKDLITSNNGGKPVEDGRTIDVVISEIPDGDTKEAIVIPILKDTSNSWRRILPCKFESNSFKIKVV